MKFTNSFLDKLAGSHDKIIVFDCEFWHVYGSRGFKPISTAPNEFFMPREIGGFTLQKTGNTWTYKKPFFVTLTPPKGKDVSYLSSAFSNVTKKTADEMDQYQAILSVPWGSAYLNTLPEEMHGVLIDGINVYLSDPNIRSAHKPASWIKTFIKELSESLVVVKGSNDLIALENACKFHGIDYIHPKKIVDIASWNVKSKKLCKTAKLEGTYECIKNKLDPEINSMKKFLPLGEAHDPSSDAAMALIVALYIIQEQ